MKNIILIAITLFMTTSVSFANSDIDKNTKDYIKTLNTCMDELDANTGIKEKATISSLLLNGINSGYLSPSLNNEIKLSDSLLYVLDNIKDYKIENNFLENKHKLLIADMEYLSNLLNDRITLKSKIIKDNNKLSKLKYILVDDNTNVNLINEKIESINKTYIEINKFN